MAQFSGPSISELPGWRIGLVFLLFCVIAIAYDHGSQVLDRYLKKHRKRALRHVIRRLQGELLVLGLLSLLLVAFESYLLRICISCSDACAWDCPERTAEGEAAGGAAAEGPGHRRQLLGGLPSVAGHAAGSSFTSSSLGYGRGGGRLLLASAAMDQLSCMQAAETCPPGSEPFWSQLAIVQSHLFLFVIAVVHICYACVSMLLCLWKLRRWQRFEQYAINNDLRPLHSRFLPRPGDNAVTHFLRCAVSMVADSVNCDVYCGMRRLFVERLDVDASFDFHGFLVESMEEEFAGMVGVNSVLWCIVLVWIMLPPQSYQLIWLSALALTTALVVAVKLQSIITCLAEDAYQLYGCRSVHPAGRSALQSMKLRLQRLSPFGGGSSSRRGGIKAGAAGAASVEAEGPSGVTHLPGQPPRRPRQRQRSGDSAAERAAMSDGGGGDDSDGGAVEPVELQTGAAVQQAEGSSSSSSYVGDAGREVEEDQEEGEGEGEEEGEESGELAPEAGAAIELARRGAHPQEAAAVAAAAGEAARRGAAAKAAGVVGRRSRRPPAAAGAGAGTAAPDAGPAHPQAGLPCSLDARPQLQASPVIQQQQQQQLEAALGMELSFDLEAQEQPAQAARAAATAASSPHPTSSVFRRCCPCLLTRLPWHRRRQRRRVSQAVERSQSFAATYQGPDAASLFWFGRPRVMLRLVQAVYFENSISVAAALFSLWQGVTFDWQRYGGWWFLLAMIGVEVLLLLFMSLTVLPVYALTTAAGSHSAASVIHHALKKNIKPEMARALQRMSLNAQAAGDAYDSGGPPDGGSSHQEAPQQPEQPEPEEGATASVEEAGTEAEAEAAAEAEVTPASWLLPPLPGISGPPALGRHSAPLPGHLNRLSPTFTFTLHASGGGGGGLPAPHATTAAAAGGEAAGIGNSAEGLASPFGAIQQQQQLQQGKGQGQSAPGSPRSPRRQLSRHTSAASRGSSAAAIDPAAVAAAATAALIGAPPSAEDDETQLSITRLMGAMYQKQLQRQLERATSACSQGRCSSSSSRNPRGALRLSSGAGSGSAASQDASRHGARLATRPSLGSLSEEPGEAAGPGQEHPAAVETCPAAVGTAWLPQLLQHLGGPKAGARSGAPAAAEAAGARRSPLGPVEGPSLGSRASDSLQPPPRASSGSGSSHPTLAHVRSLFNAAGTCTAGQAASGGDAADGGMG